MNQIPQDIDVAVREAGAKTRPYGGELPDVYRRARRRRTNRRAAAVFTAMAVAAGLVGGGLAVRRHTPVTPPIEPAVLTASTTQRLFLSEAFGTYATTTAPAPVELRFDRAVGELTPDGSLIPHRVLGGGGYDKAIGLPDGRLVALGPRDMEPGADRPGGPVVAGRVMLLTIESPGGRAVQTDIRRLGEPVSLVGANATIAYLWRPTGLFAYDLDSGLERLVITAAMLSLPDNDPAGALDASDVVGDRLVIAAKTRSCRPELLSIDPPQGLPDLPLTSLGCRAVRGLRLSPSTGRLAATYETKSGSVRVAVLSTEDGRVLADRPVTGQTVDVAWADERNLLVVPVPTGPGTHVLRPFTIPT